jgi:AhpD family alkylhydroperoxidase
MTTDTLDLPTIPAFRDTHDAPRLDFAKVSPQALAAQFGLERYARGAVDPTIYELVKLRASYMNGCAYCVDMHTKDARQAGEREQRLYAVPVWRETPFFTPRERAALAWTEALTRLGPEGVPDAVYDAVRAHFDEKELVDLSLAVLAINGWNRLAIAFRAPVGSYQPQRPAA